MHLPIAFLALSTLLSDPILVFKGHTLPPNCVAFSPDGKRIVSGSLDRTAKAWDAATGREILTFTGHKNPIWCVAFSPDGKRIASGGEDREIKVWDSSNGRELLTLPGHEKVTGVAFSPDGTRIASTSEFGSDPAKVWDAATGRQMLSLKGDAGRVFCVSYSPDGKWIATGDFVSAKLWDANTGRLIRTFQGYTRIGVFDRSFAVMSVAFSHDGKRIATGGWDHTVKVWDPESGRELLTLRGHQNAVTGLAFSPDDKRIASASYAYYIPPEDVGSMFGPSLKLWNATSGQQIRAFTLMAGVRGVAFSPDGKRIVSANCDYDQYLLTIWDVSTPFVRVPARLVGLVTSDDPAAVKDLVVHVATSDPAEEIAAQPWDSKTVRTDAQGRFVVSLRAGLLRVDVVANEEFSRLADPPGGLLLASGGERRVEIPLRKAVRITGRVIDRRSRHPVPATVFARSRKVAKFPASPIRTANT